MAGTVRDFKNMFERQTGNRWEFTQRSEQHMWFWDKLNKLGARRIRELPPEVVPDIDATVTLSDDEWSQLEQELQDLLF